MDNNMQELPKTIEPRNWNQIESAVKQGKALVRDHWGDMTVDIVDDEGKYRAIDVFGEERLVESARPEIHEFSVEWFSLPSPLPNPEDYAENDGDVKLIELFARVEMRYEHVARMNLRLENPSLTEEETLEKWLDSAQDYLPLWFMPENDKQSFYMRRKSEIVISEQVTGSTPDDELIDKILWSLGVDPVDWANSLSGIYAAIRSNQQIGEPHMSKIEDWTDGKITQNSLTETIFKVVKERDDLRLENEQFRNALDEILRTAFANQQWGLLHTTVTRAMVTVGIKAAKALGHKFEYVKAINGTNFALPEFQEGGEKEIKV